MESTQVNIVLSAIGILGLLNLAAWAWLDILLSREEKSHLIHSYLLSMAVILAEVGCLFTENHADTRTLALLFNFVGLGVSPFAGLLNSGVYHAGEKDVSWKLPSIPLFLNLAVAAASPWTGWMFWVDAAGTYTRGPLFCVFVAAIAYTVTLFVVRLTRSMRRYPRYFVTLEASCMGILLFTVLFQFMVPQMQVGWVGLALFGLMQYLFLAELRAMTDGLTGSLNRTAFNRQLDVVAESGATEGLALVMIDINRFKEVNDTKGHPYGDACLTVMAAAITRSFGPDDTVFRYGGDEFVVLCAHSTEDEVRDRVEALTEAVRERRLEDPDFPYASVGFEMWHDGEKIPELLAAADARMYEQKRAAC